MDVPIVDLSDVYPNKLDSICKDYGFFTLVNHDIQMEDILNLNAVARSFFNMPMKYKMLAHQEGSGTGYIPYQAESLGGSDGSLYKGDLKESLNISYKDVCNGEWPELPSALKEECKDYFFSMLQLSDKMLEYLAIAFGGIGRNFFTNKIRSLPNLVLRLAYYPAVEGKAAPGQFRASPHTDYGTMTFLWADDFTGLQSYDRHTDSWVDAVNLPPEALYVNIGDMLQIWTNNWWKASLHRVVVPEDRSHDRLSIVMFHNPNDDTVIYPIVRSGDKAWYEPTNARDYRKQKAVNSREIIKS